MWFEKTKASVAGVGWGCMIPNTLGTLWTDVRKQKLRNNTLTVGESWNGRAPLEERAMGEWSFPARSLRPVCLTKEWKGPGLDETQRSKP